MKDEAVETLIVFISCSAPLYYSGTLSRRLLTSMAIIHDSRYGGQGGNGATVQRLKCGANNGLMSFGAGGHV
jgi:hypothetical protein